MANNKKLNTGKAGFFFKKKKKKQKKKKKNFPSNVCDIKVGQIKIIYLATRTTFQHNKGKKKTKTKRIICDSSCKSLLLTDIVTFIELHLILFLRCMNTMQIKIETEGQVFMCHCV